MKYKLLFIVFLLAVPFVNINNMEVVSANNITYSEDEMVNKVINQIAALPKVVTLNDETLVKSARTSYDNLLPSQKVGVTNLLDLLDRENQIALLYSEISYVVTLIDNLPSLETLEINHETKINEVLNEYNKLDNLQKELVSNYSKLQALLNKLDSIYKSINNLILLIDNLPTPELIDSSIYSKIDNIELIYNSLTDYQKQRITNINKYLDIKKLINNIQILIDSINNIPETLTLESLSLLESINNEYNKLSNNQKTLVTNYQSFIKIYNEVLEAIDFNNIIEELIFYIDINNKYLLEYLFNKYNEFNDNQKVFITNYEKLLLLEQEIKKEEEYALLAKEVIDLINTIPLDISLEDKELVRNIRVKYDNLYDKSKKYVENYHLLVQAESIILKLENEEFSNSLDSLYNELNEVINEIDNIRNEVKNDEEESKQLIEDIKTFINEIKENEAKGLNKYIIIAIGLTSVFVIVAIIYIFSLNKSKIHIDNELY